AGFLAACGFDAGVAFGRHDFVHALHQRIGVDLQEAVAGGRAHRDAVPVGFAVEDVGIGSAIDDVEPFGLAAFVGAGFPLGAALLLDAHQAGVLVVVGLGLTGRGEHLAAAR